MYVIYHYLLTYKQPTNMPRVPRVNHAALASVDATGLPAAGASVDAVLTSALHKEAAQRWSEWTAREATRAYEHRLAQLIDTRAKLMDPKTGRIRLPALGHDVTLADKWGADRAATLRSAWDRMIDASLERMRRQCDSDSESAGSDAGSGSGSGSGSDAGSGSGSDAGSDSGSDSDSDFDASSYLALTLPVIDLTCDNA
jgi:uncharacterized membrane protein YgcG